MRLPRFDWVAPSSLKDASEILKGAGDRAKILAGGTDLLVAMKQRILNPDYVIDLKNIPGLSGIHILPDRGMKIGPLTKLVEVASSGVMKQYYPSLAEAASSVGSYQIRNLGTIGGNLCLDTKCDYYNQPSYWNRPSDKCRKGGGDRCYAFANSKRGCFALLSGDTVAPLITYNANIRITNSEGERMLPLEEFYTGQGLHHINLKLGEILSEIFLPPSNGARVFFSKYVPRNTIDFATVSISVSLKKNPPDARIVVGGLASAPLRLKEAEALLLQRVDDDIAADEVGKLGAATAKLISSVRGGVNYKREIIRVLIRDAVKHVQGL